jgi:cytochrome oxidase Cu insertion factor (SCO1/SenC/PrrC family)
LGATGIIPDRKGDLGMNLFGCHRRALVLGLALLSVAPGRAREPQSGSPVARVDVEGVGPKVGATLPDFNLRDQHGEARSLKSLLGSKGAVIVFFRSADW